MFSTSLSEVDLLTEFCNMPFVSQGRFEIISLTGSFLLSESGGNQVKTGGMSISLAGPDGRVVGGGVAGVLVAATPVQVCIFPFLYCVSLFCLCQYSSRASLYFFQFQQLDEWIDVLMDLVLA